MKKKLKNLLDSPSNIEIHPNGKKWIISLGKYDKSENYMTIEMIDNAGTVIKTFVSVKECASFFFVYMLVQFQVI